VAPFTSLAGGGPGRSDFHLADSLLL